MIYTRREFGIAAVSAGAAFKLKGAEKPNSKFSGVQIGAITYSYRQLPNSNDAKTVLQYVLDSRISATDMMGPVAENYAGARSAGRGGFPGGEAGRAPGGPPAGGPPSRRRRCGWWTGTRRADALDAGAGRAAEGRRGPEGMAALRFHGQVQGAAADVQRRRRQHLRLQTRAAAQHVGRRVRLHFNVAEALGANHLTLELSNDEAFLKRVGDFAAKRHMRVAYHALMQASISQRRERTPCR